MPEVMTWLSVLEELTGRGYTGAMTTPARIQPGELIKPLPLASYAAWLAVYVTNTGLFGVQDADHGLAAHWLLWLFLLAWLLALMIDSRREAWLGSLCTVTLTAAALGFLLFGHTGTGAILLVLLATQLAMQFPGRGLMISLAAVNLAFLAIMRLRWGYSWNQALITMGTYTAFQAFAALSMHYAIRAETMATRLQQVNAHLLATRSLLSEAARDQERLRLSRELHDVAGHKLTALKLNLGNLARHSDLADSRELTIASSLAGELLDDLRAVVRQLRDHDGIDLATGIRSLIEPLPSPKVVLSLDDSARIPGADQAEALLRVAQEGLTNAARHGHAQNAWLEFRRDSDGFVLQLEDDGQLSWPITPGNGLRGMRERVESLGGQVMFEPSGRGGLHLCARLPARVPA